MKKRAEHHVIKNGAQTTFCLHRELFLMPIKIDIHSSLVFSLHGSLYCMYCEYTCNSAVVEHTPHISHDEHDVQPFVRICNNNKDNDNELSRALFRPRTHVNVQAHKTHKIVVE